MMPITLELCIIGIVISDSLWMSSVMYRLSLEVSGINSATPDLATPPTIPSPIIEALLWLLWLCDN